MTIQGLHIKLKELGVLEDRYYLHGVYGATNDDDKVSLTIREGTYSIEYEVYFKERGVKHSARIFTSEEEACQYLYKRLKDNKEIEDRLKVKKTKKMRTLKSELYLGNSRSGFAAGTNITAPNFSADYYPFGMQYREYTRTGNPKIIIFTMGRGFRMA